MKFQIATVLVGILATSIIPGIATAQTLKYQCELQLGVVRSPTRLLNEGKATLDGTFPLIKGDGKVWLDFSEKFKNPPEGLRYAGILTIRRTSLPQKPNETTVGLSLQENGKELVEVNNFMRHPLALGVPAELNAFIPHSAASISVDREFIGRSMLVLCRFSLAATPPDVSPTPPAPRS